MITIGKTIRSKEIFVLTFFVKLKNIKSQNLKNTQQVYPRTGLRCIFFYISMFVVSVIIGRYE